MTDLPPTLAAAITAMREGRMVVMVDDEDRENEGDVVMAAQFATPEAVNFMVTHARGLICLPLEADRIDHLQLPMMTANNRSPHQTPFTISIEATTGVTTGISAADRARTILAAVAHDAQPADLVSPGHIFPLRANPGGVVTRNGHTEAVIDLARLAGLTPAGVICEVMSENGEMARLPELKTFAQRHNLPVLTIAELVAWCREHGRNAVGPLSPRKPEPAITFIAEAALPSIYGGEDLRIHAFRAPDGTEHIALVKGNPSTTTPIVRLHSECVTGDALGSMRCDCGVQLREALARIGAADSGILLYLRGHEGRGIGLGNKIRAYTLQEQGMDTLDANRALGLPDDARSYDAASAILHHLGVTRLVLLTNNPDKASALEADGLEIIRREALETEANPFNRDYLHTKRTRMGHSLSEALHDLADSARSAFSLSSHH